MHAQFFFLMCSSLSISKNWLRIACFVFGEKKKPNEQGSDINKFSYNGINHLIQAFLVNSFTQQILEMKQTGRTAFWGSTCGYCFIEWRLVKWPLRRGWVHSGPPLVFSFCLQQKKVGQVTITQGLSRSGAPHVFFGLIVGGWQYDSDERMFRLCIWAHAVLCPRMHLDFQDRWFWSVHILISSGI